MRYKDTDKSLSQIGRELNVEAVVEGAVLREAEQVRVTVQLSEVRTEKNLWADRYDRHLTSILKLQGELAQVIARQIQITLTPGEKSLLSHREQINPEAFEAFLKGQSHWNKLTQTDLKTALRYFELALNKEPRYALAWVGVALVWIGRQQMGYTPPLEAGPKAKEAALRAVELDDNLAEAHYVLALVRSWTDWDWAGGEVSFLRAVELNPNHAETRAYYAHYLMTMGRMDESCHQMGLAVELDPLNPLLKALRGAVFQALRQYDQAIEQAHEVLESVPNHPVALWILLDACHSKGVYDEALRHAKLYFASVSGIGDVGNLLDAGFAEGGFPGAMQRLAEEWELVSRSRPIPQFDIAQTYLYAGNTKRALDWLERAYEERDPNVPYLLLWPGCDNVRADPRFLTLVRRMNFPDAALKRFLPAPSEQMENPQG